MVVDTLYRNVKVRGQLWEIDSLSLSLPRGVQELNSGCPASLPAEPSPPYLLRLSLSLSPQLTGLAVLAGPRVQG